MTQEYALKILKTGANVFLTGEPGSGKSHTTREYISYLKDSGIEPAVTASTGIASTHIHGRTIHSWAGIGIKKNLSSFEIEAIADKAHVFKRIDKTKVLIIDEISMLDADTLESVDAVCRAVKRNPAEAFGGIQVVLVGDFFQLPPVSKGGGEFSSFSFNSKSWRDLNPAVCYLSEQHRQDDKNYLELLSSIRRNKFGEKHSVFIKSRMNIQSEAEGSVTRLFSHNQDVDGLNLKRLSQIEGQSETFEMETDGKENLVEALKRGCLSPETLELKVGAVVMCTKNNPIAGFVNGTLGEVTGFAKGSRYPIIRTKTGRTIEIEPAEWALEENGKILARIIQIPLRLAWAITIHKSQGMSLDSAVMDLSQVFEYGQGYVALSRVRRLSGLYLEGLNKKALEVHPEILRKDIEFKKASAQARLAFEAMETSELKELHKNFVKAIGGKFVEEDKRPKKSQERKIGAPDSFQSTYDITKELLLKRKSIVEIAEERGLKNETVISHVEDLLSAGRIKKKDIMHLLPKDSENKKDFSLIQEAFEEIGGEKLKPVFEYFRGKYSYEMIRLARIISGNLSKKS